ncbi:MAG: hypothetical protein M5U07_12165 [Xanthobacteraceae bacterium]|nr:hypothetical protein [Xanthobacteraceae bacterium]
MKHRHGSRAAALFACALWLVPAAAQPTTIAQDMASAAAAYADEKARDTVKEQSRAAITALYKKIYRSGADKRLVRTLGAVALSAEEIDTLAENAANAVMLGDPEAVKAASAQVAVALGQTLTRGLADAELRGRMSALLGGVDRVNEIAAALGQAAGGDSTAALELAGRALIAMTPAAAVFTTAETAVGAMKYLQGKFVDRNIEELYRKYVDGDAQTRADIRTRLETAGVYSYIVRDRRIDLAAERADAIARATAEPGDRVRERLTAARESEVVDDILRTFAARARQERAAAEVAQARQQAQAEAAAMIDALDATARGRYGRDWWKGPPPTPRTPPPRAPPPPPGRGGLPHPAPPPHTRERGSCCRRGSFTARTRRNIASSSQASRLSAGCCRATTARPRHRPRRRRRRRRRRSLPAAARPDRRRARRPTGSGRRPCAPSGARTMSRSGTRGRPCSAASLCAPTRRAPVGMRC